MHILIIHNYYTIRGGEEVYIDNLCRYLEKRGHKITLFSRDNQAVNKNLLWPKTSIALKLFYNYDTNRSLSDIIQKSRPDIAHFHNVYPQISPTAYRVCKRYNLPMIQTIHNYRFLCPMGQLYRGGKICELCVKKSFPYPAIVYKCYSNSYLASTALSNSIFFHKLAGTFTLIDAFIFSAKFTQNYYRKNLNLPINKTHIIPHFVFPYRKRNKQAKRDYFLFVGRLSEEKGILPLLRVFSQLPKINLVIIGDGPLREKVNFLKKYRNIHIKGSLSHSDVLSYMASAYCTVIPSLSHEIGPLVLLESFASGTPVLVPDIGVFRTIVQHGKTGECYKYNDWEDLRVKVLHLSRNKRVVKKMGIAAHREYLDNYTPEIHYRKLLSLYKDLRVKSVSF